jgi:hypothetical protein
VKSKAIKERLIAFPADKLPSVDKAKDYVRQWREARLRAMQRQADFHPEQLHAALQQRHAIRRAELDKRREALKNRHSTERAALAGAHSHEERGVADRRRRHEPKGLLHFLGKITGVNALIRHRQKKQDLGRAERQGAELAGLEQRHEREIAEFSRHYRALARVENREINSLETAIRRETIRQAVVTPRHDRTSARQIFNERAPAREVRPAGREIEKPEPVREVFNETAQAPERNEREKANDKSRPPKIRDVFREETRPPEKEPDIGMRLRDRFNQKPPANDRAQEPRRRTRDRDRDFDLER